MNNLLLRVTHFLWVFVLLLAVVPCNAQNTKNEEQLISIIGTGDIMLGSNYPSAAKLPSQDGKELLREVKNILRDADVTFGNLEGCFLDKGGNAKPCKNKKYCYLFRMPDRYVNYLTDAGYDVMSLANNHMSDFGEPGRTNTQKVLKGAGIHYAGLKDVCETTRFEKDGIKYGFVAFAPNRGTVSIKDIPAAKQIVQNLDRDCDIVIVSFHGGAEGQKHRRVPKKTENFLGENRGDVQAFAHAVIDAGADVVFGHGPHVVRASELYKDRFIIYSLGNFCTAGDFNISGANGYAPIIKVFTDREGRFVKGQIYSAIQKDKRGPVIDSNHSAAKEIKRLTELDFPNTDLTITDDGTIRRKSVKAEVNINTIPSTPLLFGEMTFEDYEIMKYGESFDLSINPYQLPSYVLPEWFTIEDEVRYGDELANNIIEYSKQYLGRPYRRGTRGPKSFDCSGFTHYVFKQFGYNLSPGCVTQVNQGTKIDKSELRTGDLIFFKGRNAKSSRVGHVGIVVENNGGNNITFIHACHRGVIIENLSSSSYYKPRYVTGLRVLS